jgi:hypothetical protein
MSRLLLDSPHQDGYSVLETVRAQDPKPREGHRDGLAQHGARCVRFVAEISNSSRDIDKKLRIEVFIWMTR